MEYIIHFNSGKQGKFTTTDAFSPATQEEIARQFSACLIVSAVDWCGVRFIGGELADENPE